MGHLSPRAVPSPDHRHTATPEHREEMQDLYVTPWLTYLFKQEEAAAGKQADIDELERACFPRSD